jgi:hypothetical protein
VLALFILGCIENGAPTDLPPSPPTNLSPVKWVMITPASATLAPGSSVPLNLSLEDDAGRELSGVAVTWRSTDSTVATVSDSGVVSTKRTGSANIVATSGTQSAYAVINVSTAPPPTLFVSVSPGHDSLVVRGTLQLFATVRDEHGALVPEVPLAWSTSNGKVVTVSASGVVTGVGAGTANVTVKAGTNTATAQISVSDAPPPPPTSPPPPPPSTPPPASTASLFSSYRTTSPHWPHIRTMMTDFYYGWTSSERSWAVQHYDWAMSGDGTAWKSGNPGVTHLTYTLEWTTLVPGQQAEDLEGVYYTDMKAWYAQHPQYHLENAFMHVRGAAAHDSASRLVISIWNSKRWVIDPADDGARAYTVDRYRRLAAGEDGVFIDEAASGDILGRIANAAELPTAADYEPWHTSLIAAIKQALGAKIVMLNLGEYSTDFDRADALAARSVHLEKVNNPLFSELNRRWQWMEDLMANGVTVNLVNVYSTKDANRIATSFPKGNYGSSAQRMKMMELASYYMVVGRNPDNLVLTLENTWDAPYSTLWLKAQEADIGHPTASRTILGRGTDPVGQSYTIYSRDFDRALVVVRTQQGWGTQSYLDATAVTVPLPPGEQWRPLHADGTVGDPVTSVHLRNAEAMILIKGSRL